MGQGIEIHPLDVNDKQSLMADAKFGVPRLCTGNFK
jgi:hypothetical protein